MGFCTSGSAAKTVALKPGGNRSFAAASVAGIGLDLSGSELYGTGNSDAHKLNGASSNISVFFMAGVSGCLNFGGGSLSSIATEGDPGESFFSPRDDWANTADSRRNADTPCPR